MARGYHYNTYGIYEPKDIIKIKNLIPVLKKFDDTIIDHLWSDFSETWYCAGWLYASEGTIESFKLYLFTEKQDGMK